MGPLHPSVVTKFNFVLLVNFMAKKIMVILKITGVDSCNFQE